MKRIYALCTTLTLLLALATTAAAQDVPDEQHPLLELLALVPDVPAALENVPAIGYINYAALEAARPGVGVFEDGAAFEAAREAHEEGAGLWMANNNRMIVEAGNLTIATISGGGETRELAGFDLFDVDHLLMFGAPPQTAFVLRGDFDAEAIVAAHEARGYAVAKGDGLVQLSRADGEPGTTMDLAGVNRANPFGGQFGRLEPVILADDLILNSASDETIERLTGTLARAQRSVLSRPSIVAAAEALTDAEPVLLQAAPSTISSSGISCRL